MSEKMFEEASRLKLRFQSNRGILSVEDLWSLPLVSKTDGVSLDILAKDYYHQLKEEDDSVSFVEPVKEVNKIPTLKLEIIKYIISVRLAERDAKAQELQRREQKQRLLALISNKEDEVLAGKSLNELREMVDQL
jgi:hypothetical protein